MRDREDLYRDWVAWVTTNLGRDGRLTEIAASAATDAAQLGRGFNGAAEAARTAWSDAAKRYSADRRRWWDGTRWESLPPSRSATGLREHHWWIVAIVALLVIGAEWFVSMALTNTGGRGSQSPALSANSRCQMTSSAYPPYNCADGGVLEMFSLADSGRSREVLWSDRGSQTCQSLSVGVRVPDDVDEQQLAADLLQASLKEGVIQYACGGGDVFGYATGTGPRGPFTKGHLVVLPFSMNSGICCQGRTVTFTAGSESKPGNTWHVVIGPQPGDRTR